VPPHRCDTTFPSGRGAQGLGCQARRLSRCSASKPNSSPSPILHFRPPHSARCHGPDSQAHPLGDLDDISRRPDPRRSRTLKQRFHTATRLPRPENPAIYYGQRPAVFAPRAAVNRTSGFRQLPAYWAVSSHFPRTSSSDKRSTKRLGRDDMPTPDTVAVSPFRASFADRHRKGNGGRRVTSGAVRVAPLHRPRPVGPRRWTIRITLAATCPSPATGISGVGYCF